MDETIQTQTQKDFFNKMFDSLQEGICTIDNDKILFMNELCNTLTSQLSGLRDFENNINENDEKPDVNPLDRKIFFIFQNENGGDNIKGFKKAKVTSSDG